MSQSQGPSPVLMFDTITAYQKSAMIKAAIELDVFTAIGEGSNTAPALAQTCQTSERGMRILCDNLVIHGFLTKQGDLYNVTQDTAVFLDKRSRAYMGSVVDFLMAPTVMTAFDDLATTVRTGRTLLPGEGSVDPDHPMWVDFARAMAPMMAMPAQFIVGLIGGDPGRKLKVLDIAAGHGLFGASCAQAFPNAEVTWVDWANVLAVAKENAHKMGVGDRCQSIEGDAFDVEFGGGYDIVLLTNFLHHFDPATNEKLLRKVHAALADGGRALTLEFVPNDDRVTPPGAAQFSLIMLGTTPCGDAYTFGELSEMFNKAGFASSELCPVEHSPQSVVISKK